ncbi:sialidase family protein [Nibrella saemangeumensis]|uniref:Sialidase family protein n=1 Tax=Nibrella saemangeumensis TaxID=1084526 RepID=A0ABP8NUI8_9BACT
MKKLLQRIALLTAITCLFSYPIMAQQPVTLDAGQQAALPRFTTDHQGNPVISWVEKANDQAALFFCVSADGGRTFNPKIRVAAPGTMSTHPEGRPRIAFKKDGTLIATVEISKPTDDSPRASDLLFVQSTDGGRTWTLPKPVHQDVTPGKGHSFSDLITLPNGEVGAVWLDEKLPGQEGRSVKFAQTTPGGGFTHEILIDSSACQCCRTSLAVTSDGGIHVAYRDLLADGSRDMSYARSADGGRTFSKPTVIYADHWQLNACPHSGIQLVAAGNEVLATWYSGKEGEAGLRLTRVGQQTLLEKPQTSAMKAPQLAVLADNRLALCWEEWVGEGPGAYRKIGLKYLGADGASQPVYLTRPGEIATQPTLLATKQGLLLAYTRLQGASSALVLVYLNPNTTNKS